MHYESYTEGEIIYLRQRYADGAGCSEIAQDMDRTSGQIRWKLKQLGLFEAKPSGPGRPKRPITPEWSEADVDGLTKLWRLGLSASEIGVMLHKTRSAILGKLNRMDMLRSHRKAEGRE